MDTPEPAPGLRSRLLPLDRPWQIALLTLFGLGVAAILLLALATMILTPTLPAVDGLAESRLKVPMRVYTADGVLIGEFGEERRIPVSVDQVPEQLMQAVLASEDTNFYRHHGVDFLGIARAAWTNFRAGGHKQGASTITMQVARNFFLSPEKTYTRKFKEVLLAFKLERELSKDEILELYLNKIFLGHRAYGFAAAAKIYYGKKLDELTLPEMAMLAGLPKAPSRNNPLTNPEPARERRNYVLRRMHKLGYVDKAIYRASVTAPLSARKHALTYDVEAPYIAEMVRRYMIDTYENQTYAGGFHVYTTLHSGYQRAANRALRNTLLEYERRHGYRGPAGHVNVDKDTDRSLLDEALKNLRAVGNLIPGVVLMVEERSVAVYTQDGDIAEVDWPGLSWARRFIDVNRVGPLPKTAADILSVGDIIYLEKRREGRWRLAQVPRVAGALVALRPDDGAILALSGGFDFRSSKFNRVTQAERQPGSNIKPFIYSAALEKGFTAATPVSGAPIAIEDANLEDVWRPENYSGKFFGPTRLRKALKLSLNLVSVRLLRAIGPGYAADYLARFGFERDKLPRNLSLALGSASFTPLTMVRAFSVFANGGFRVQPYFISRVETGDGTVLEQARPLVVCPQCPETRLTETEKAEQQNEQEATPPENPARAAEAEASPEEPDPAAETGGPRWAPRVIRPENAFIITDIMQDVIKTGTGRRALVLGREDLAGKTGTTNEFRDAWFSGFNANIAATTWVGFDQPATLGRGEAGSRAALPMWIRFMRTALKDFPERTLEPPPGVELRLVNEETGQPTTLEDPLAIEEYFIVGRNGDAQTPGGPGQPEPGAGTPGTPGQAPPPPPAPQKLPEGLF